MMVEKLFLKMAIAKYIDIEQCGTVFVCECDNQDWLEDLDQSWEDFKAGVRYSKYPADLSDKSECFVIKCNFEDLVLLDKISISLDNGTIGLVILDVISDKENTWKAFVEYANTKKMYIKELYSISLRHDFDFGVDIKKDIIVLTKEKTDEMFVFNGKVRDLIERMVTFKNWKNVYEEDNFCLIKPEEFNGFRKLNVKREIDSLSSSFKDFNKFKIKDLIFKSFEAQSCGENSLQLNLATGNIQSFPDIDSKTRDLWSDQSFYKVEDFKGWDVDFIKLNLKPNLIRRRYLEVFLKTKLGELMMQLTKPNKRDALSIENFLNTEIPVPCLEDQDYISLSFGKIERLHDRLSKYNEVVSLRPMDFKRIEGVVDDLLGILEELTEVEIIENALTQGENKTIEFKETLLLDTRTNKKEKYLSKKVLITIAAFLNTQGGVLLVGVNNEKKITGIDKEQMLFFDSDDRYLLHFKNLIKDAIGEQFYDFVSYKIVLVNDKKVLLVQCKPAKCPCYLDSKEFYVRINPAIDLLEGANMVEYIKHHFWG